MPILENVTTKSAEEVWRGGDRTIWKVVMDVQGKEFKAKTYSSVIASSDFTGDVLTYDKPGKFGSETFVKQAPKEDAAQSPLRATATPTGSLASGKYEMYLSYSKDLLVALQQTTGFDQTAFDKLLQAAIDGANTLYAARPDAPKTQKSQVVDESTLAGEHIELDNDPFAGLGNVDQPTKG